MLESKEKKTVRVMIEILQEFWAFLRIRKKYWLLPIVLALTLVGALVVMTSGTAVAPFIYTIF